MTMRHGVGVGLAMALAGTLVVAQDAQAPPVFRTGTDLVTVDALVTDDHGQAVTGLTADDFRITEKGRVQTITALTFMTRPLVARSELDPVPAAPIRDVVTNQTTPHSRAYAIVIDDLHLMPFHGEQVRRVLTDLLGSIPVTDRVAVVFTGRSDLSIDLTDDRAAQLQAVARIKGALGLAMDPQPISCGPNEIQRRHQALGSLGVLRNVAMTLAHTRADVRTVVYLSEGFNFDFSAMPVSAPTAQAPPTTLSGPGGGGRGAKAVIPDQRTCDEHGHSLVIASQSALPGDPEENPGDAQLVRETLQDILGAASRSDVRIYTIDPRGNQTKEEEVTGWVTGTPQGQQAIQSKITVQNDLLRTVAAETGALAAVQRSDLHGAVRELLADTSSYYLLGYTPDPLPQDGQYHEIDVKVLRPGLHVRARKGYTASEAHPKVLTGAKALSADLAGGDATGDITLAGFVAPVAANGKVDRTVVTLEVTYPGPTTLPASIVDDLETEIVEADVEGTGHVVSTRAFHFALTPTRTGDATFLVNTVVDLAPGLTNLRLGLVSKATGKVGTLAMPVRIPNLSDKALQVASLVVGLQDATEPAMPPDGLAGLLPFQPTLRRMFGPQEVLRVFAPLSWGAKAETASVTIDVTGPGTTVHQTASAPGTPSATGLRRATLNQTIPLATLGAGDHELAITVTVPGEKPVTRTIGFAVAPRGTDVPARR